MFQIDRGHQGRTCERDNNPSPEELLFVNQYGTRYRKMRKALKTACENARVRHYTHHSLRHAYATIARQRGTDIGMQIRRLRRTSISIGEMKTSIKPLNGSKS